ncbi:hypothetical protein [Stutzerimonas nitrititolerans]|uniref:hypothetical protein n=1 Tax=Stutzerimonas nitrititolerans TaxID=2482751 RepID=UPI0028A6A0C0|nr:hypothetical protein [Stutzerimonas nitrititolerans]
MARDPNDFTEVTRTKVLKRACYGCSFPGCGIPLVGPHTDGNGTVFTGEVAHIQGARPAANNRYNSHMSPEQRSHHSNAIVLCRTHAKLIDSDEDKYTVEKLYAWKLDHEAKSSRRQAGENVDDEYIDKPYEKCTDEELAFDREYRRNLIKRDYEDRKNSALKLFAASIFFALLIFIWHTISGGWNFYMAAFGMASVIFPGLVAFKLVDEKSDFTRRQESSIQEINYRLKERGAE